jgi:HPt (histidine-containing phosphotransfer) domain-containing protein
MENPCVFNQSHFNNFTGDTNEQKIMMAHLFIEQVGHYYRDLEESCMGTAEDWAENLHRLKGIASFAGAEILFELCASNQAVIDRTNYLEKIDTAINDVREAIKNYLKFMEVGNDGIPA